MAHILFIDCPPGGAIRIDGLMNIERGFRRTTLVVSLAVLGLACWLIAWPAVGSIWFGLSYMNDVSIDRPYRFVVQSNTSPYLVSSRRAVVTNDELGKQLQFSRLGQFEHRDPDLVMWMLCVGHEDRFIFSGKCEHGLVFDGAHRPGWIGITSFLLPYLLATVGLTAMPWGMFYLLRWIVRGFL